MARRILVVDDTPDQCALIARMLASAGYVTCTANSGPAAMKIIASDPALGAIILDLVMPDMDGFGVLAALKNSKTPIPVIAIAATEDDQVITSALKAGATDYVARPITPTRLLTCLANAIRLARFSLQPARQPFSPQPDPSRLLLPGTVSDRKYSPAMNLLAERARRAARSRHPVLIEGEPATGKSALAGEIYRAGPRAAKPALVMDCHSHGPACEATLFGTTDRPGLLARAQGATLILEEIGDLELAT
ncbi:MAG: sigma-54-dependent Fis family transcriptional regulator, partial [Alphaproteobacteria bacterium]|nr:sigma-54-dependent Fis family transcriptional regulator [Alphaproteobacteria bacterium]